MFSSCCDAGATPGPTLIHCGALRVHHASVPEGELTGGPGGGGAGGDGEALGGAGGAGGHGAVTPAVSDDTAVSVGGSGTPWDRGVSVGTLVVRHTTVAEGKNTAGACSEMLLELAPVSSQVFST